MVSDTITAISTPVGEGAIAIVRMSGAEAFDIASKLFVSVSGKKIPEMKSHTIHYGHLVDPASGNMIDEVMVTVLKGPNTFTKEDIIEINCHGGLVTVNRVLQLVLFNGARLAEPGEFTKRAFMNGRIDLSQAEAVIDLIRAKTDKAMAIALGQVDGRLSQMIRSLRLKILEVLAQVEVNIDYPEYDDVGEVSHHLLMDNATWVQQQIGLLLETAEQGKVLREGISTAIIGKPNVGKSSLLNSLIQENKAIVTDIPGTTRDVIEEYINIKGIPLKLIDTAGIRETDDVVEKIGVERSLSAIAQADLVLFVLNSSEPVSDEEITLLTSIHDKKVILVFNKSDLPSMISMGPLADLMNQFTVIRTSALHHDGVSELESAIAELFLQGDVSSRDMTYVSNARHVALLHQASVSVQAALEAINAGVPIDIVQIDMVNAWESLGEIIGENVQDGLIDQLFSQFCLGK